MQQSPAQADALSTSNSGRDSLSVCISTTRTVDTQSPWLVWLRPCWVSWGRVWRRPGRSTAVASGSSCSTRRWLTVYTTTDKISSPQACGYMFCCCFLFIYFQRFLCETNYLKIYTGSIFAKFFGFFIHDQSENSFSIPQKTFPWYQFCCFCPQNWRCQLVARPGGLTLGFALYIVSYSFTSHLTQNREKLFPANYFTWHWKV